MNLFEQESPRQTRRKPIGQGLFGEGNYFFDDPTQPESLSPMVRDEMLDELSGSAGQAISSAGYVIDTPDAYFRGLLAGKPGERVSGEDLLQSYGALPDSNALGGWGRPAAAFAAEVALSPINLLTFGGSALTKAGRVAKAAGMLEDAGKVASRQLINSGDELTSFGKNAAESWSSNFGKGIDDLTDTDLAARPLVGPRLSRKQITLEDLVGAQTDQAAAIKKIDDAAGWSDYNSLSNSRLGGDIGVRLPFTNIGATANLPIIGDYASGGLDRLGQFARWSAPGRYANSLFNSGVAGNVEEGGQILAKQVSDARKLGDEAGRRVASESLQGLSQEAFTPDNQLMLRRVLAGPNVASAADIAKVQANNGMQDLVDRWRAMAPDYLQRSKDAGIGSAELKDPFGTLYFPRHANKNIFPDMNTNSGSGKMDFSTITGDQMSRSDALKVPGGEALIQRLSLDPNVAGFNRTAATDLDAARYIKTQADSEIRRLFPAGSAPKYTDAQALQLARTLHRIDPEAIKRGYPLFGSSVGEDLTRYVTGREKSLRVADTLYDAIASAARPQNYASINTRMADGGYRSYTTAQEALGRLGLQTTKDAAGNDVGATKQLLDRLVAKFGAGAVSDLSQVAIDERLFGRLTRISDFYSSPEAQNSLLTFLDDFTKLFKGSILAWPARFVRDWYSAVISNFFEVRNPLDLRKGYQGARYLIQGQYDRLDSVIRGMPRYSGMNEAARKQAFLSDLAASQVLTGRGLADVGDELVSDMSGTGLMSELIPGSAPRTTSGMQIADLLSGRMPLSPSNASYSELLSGSNWMSAAKKLPGQMRHPIKAMADKEVVNPILRWSNKLGDTTDALNRSAGYIALLRQGLDPMEAARRIKESQVDYSSLTKFERNVLRRIFPWYAYNSRILKYVSKELYDNPGGMYSNFAIRLPEKLQQNDEEQYVPQAIREKLGINLNRLAGKDPFSKALVGALSPSTPGSTPFLVDIDLPGSDTINLFSPRYDPETGNLALGLTAKETLKSVVNQASPIIRTPLEWATGFDFDTKRDLRSMETTPQVLLRYAGAAEKGDPLDRAANQIAPWLDFIPFMPRAGQTLRRLADDKRIPDFSTRLGQTMFNTFTGMKVQNVTDEARTQDARMKIEELLEPYSKSFEQRYIPKEQIPGLPPEIAQLYLLDRMLNREQRLREKERKARSRPMSLLQ